MHVDLELLEDLGWGYRKGDIIPALNFNGKYLFYANYTDDDGELEEISEDDKSVRERWEINRNKY